MSLLLSYQLLYLLVRQFFLTTRFSLSSLLVFTFFFFRLFSCLYLSFLCLIFLAYFFLSPGGNNRAAGLLVAGLLSAITAFLARTAGTAILGRKLGRSQRTVLRELQLTTAHLLFGYIYASVILGLVSIIFAIGELTMDDHMLGVVGLINFIVLFVGVILAIRALSLETALRNSFQL